ncbi:MAG: hypothetical protein SGPRY_014582, partial [Prymnesium sp.]
MLYENFRVDMLAAGYPGDDICKIDYFTRTFNTAEELKHMQMMTTYTREISPRSPVALKLTLIVDMMDSPKNHTPWFTNGRKPKDNDSLLKNGLKLHVT